MVRKGSAVGIRLASANTAGEDTDPVVAGTDLVAVVAGTDLGEDTDQATDQVVEEGTDLVATGIDLAATGIDPEGATNLVATGIDLAAISFDPKGATSLDSASIEVVVGLAVVGTAEQVVHTTVVDTIPEDITILAVVKEALAVRTAVS